MNENCQFHVGQLITLKYEFLKPGAKDFHYTGLWTLLDEIKKRTGYSPMPSRIQANVKRINENSISVEWINPWSTTGESLNLGYAMKDYEFEEYSQLGSVVAGHTHVSPVVVGHTHVSPGSHIAQSCNSGDIKVSYDAGAFEEINPQARVSFKSTKLVANKIQNPKDIENFLLMNP